MDDVDPSFDDTIEESPESPVPPELTSLPEPPSPPPAPLEPQPDASVAKRRV
jgi:hypothetical protein